jgi:hypothetical protein
VAAWVAFSSATGCGDCWIGVNKGGLAMLFFLCQVADLFDVDLHDLTPDEF